MIDFTKLDLTIESMVAEDLLETSLYESELSGLGRVFLDIESKYKINALYLCAHALLETNFGRKKEIKKNKNLFNIRQIDKEKISTVMVFERYEQGIDMMARLITLGYFAKEKEKNLETICKHYSPNKKWMKDISELMNKIILTYEKIQKLEPGN